MRWTMRSGLSTTLSSAIIATTLIAVTSCSSAPTALHSFEGNSPTVDFRAAVDEFMAAVHYRDQNRLVALNSDRGTPAGIREVLAAYGGATMTVTGFDPGNTPGEGLASINVLCKTGGRAAFQQAFDGHTGRWRPTMFGADTAAYLVAAPPSAVLSTADQAFVKYGLYPPCNSQSQ